MKDDFKSLLEEHSLEHWYNYIIVMIGACGFGMAGGLAMSIIDRYGSPDRPPTPKEMRKPVFYYLILALLLTIPVSLFLAHAGMDPVPIFVISFFSGMGAATILMIISLFMIKMYKWYLNKFTNQSISKDCSTKND